jgi:hypothetical protein
VAQKTAWTGAALTESDINTYLMGEGGAWTSYTPTLTQSAAVTKTVTRGVYARYGRTIHFIVSLAVTGSGTSSNMVTVSLPVTAAAAGFFVGVGQLYDATGPTVYRGFAYLQSTTTVAIDPSNSTAAGLLGANVFTAALASGDAVLVSGTYEAAS